MSFKPEYLMALSRFLEPRQPYLFFGRHRRKVEKCESSQTNHRSKKSLFKHLPQFRRIAIDTRVGMAFSNLVAFFIILTLQLRYTTYRILIGFKQRRMPQKRCTLGGTFRVSAFRDWHRGNRNARDPGSGRLSRVCRL